MDPESFVRGGPNLIILFFFLLLFLVEEGIEDQSITINGPSSARQQWPDIECWLGSFVNFQGIQTSTAKKTYIFVNFQGGGGGGGGGGGVRHLVPLLDPPMREVCFT